MPRPGKLFLPLDVHFFDDDMFEEVGEQAAVLYLAMCCKAKALMSDGVLTYGQTARIGLVKWQQRLATLLQYQHVVELEAKKLWIVAFNVHNPTAADIAEKRHRDRERKRSVRKPNAVPLGIRTDSALRDKTETREDRDSVTEDCEHGVDRFASCAACARDRKAGSA